MPPVMSRTEKIVYLLRSIPARMPEVVGGMVISTDGLIMATMQVIGGDWDWLTCRYANALSLGQHLAKFSGAGETREIQICADDYQYTLLPLYGEAFVVLMHTPLPVDELMSPRIYDILAGIDAQI